MRPGRLAAAALLLCALAAVDAAEDGASRSGPAGAPATGSPGSQYQLYPGDLIEIVIYDHPDLTTSLRIPSDGPVSFPLIGRIEAVRGRNLADFGAELKQRLEADYLQKADITITVKEFGKRRAYVSGSVARPSALDLNPFAPTTALRAISEAGGFLDEANRGGVTVVHVDEVTGQAIAEPVVIGGVEAKDVTLRPDDVIVVPRLDRVYISGQVNRPGAINLPSEGVLTVSKAISLAGGFDKYARESDVQLLRAGQPARSIDVAGILSGEKGKDDQRLLPGDTVFIPQRRY